MTDPRQSTKNYTQPHPVPASDTLVLGAAKATSYGPRVEPYNDGIVEPAKSDMDADFWSVYEWRTSRHALEGGWWEWIADCDTENVARTLAEAIARGAQQPAAVNDAMVDRAEANLAAHRKEQSMNTIELAKQAGFTANDEQEVFLHVYREEIERFASLVRNATLEEAAQEAERWQNALHDPRYECDCATAIRAMKEQA